MTRGPYQCSQLWSGKGLWIEQDVAEQRVTSGGPHPGDFWKEVQPLFLKAYLSISMAKPDIY